MYLLNLLRLVALATMSLGIHEIYLVHNNHLVFVNINKWLL